MDPKLGPVGWTRNSGFTLVETVIVLLIGAALFGMLGTFIWRNARQSRATDRKLQAISAVHYLAGRLRRDLKSARDFSVEENGARLVVTDAQDRKRVYQYDPKERILTIPDLVDPGSSSPYTLARFREVRFQTDIDAGGVTYVLSAVPYYDTGAKLTDEEIGWGSAISGRVTVFKRTQSNHFPAANPRGL